MRKIFDFLKVLRTIIAAFLIPTVGGFHEYL